MKGSTGTIKTIYYVASSEVALGIFGMEIVFWFVCCVDEAKFGVWKMFVNELLQFLLYVV